MVSEEYLLNILVSEGTQPAEKEAAASRLRKLKGMDRDALVKYYLAPKAQKRSTSKLTKADMEMLIAQHQRDILSLRASLSLANNAARALAQQITVLKARGDVLQSNARLDELKIKALEKQIQEFKNLKGINTSNEIEDKGVRVVTFLFCLPVLALAYYVSPLLAVLPLFYLIVKLPVSRWINRSKK